MGRNSYSAFIPYLFLIQIPNKYLITNLLLYKLYIGKYIFIIINNSFISNFQFMTYRLSAEDCDGEILKVRWSNYQISHSNINFTKVIFIHSGAYEPPLQSCIRTNNFTNTRWLKFFQGWSKMYPFYPRGIHLKIMYCVSFPVGISIG